MSQTRLHEHIQCTTCSCHPHKPRNWGRAQRPEPVKYLFVAQPHSRALRDVVIQPLHEVAVVHVPHAHVRHFIGSGGLLLPRCHIPVCRRHPARRRANRGCALPRGVSVMSHEVLGKTFAVHVRRVGDMKEPCGRALCM